MTHNTITPSPKTRLMGRVTVASSLLVAGLVASPAMAGQSYKFCLRYADGIHDDQSPVETGEGCIDESDCVMFSYYNASSGADCPPGVNQDCEYDLWEDLQRNDGTKWRLHRAYVSATDSGDGTGYTGYIDGDGCFWVWGETTTTWDIIVLPYYKDFAQDLFFRVQNCPSSVSNCSVDSQVISDFDPSTTTSQIEVPENSSFTVFAAAAHVMERNVDGINDFTSDTIDLTIKIDGSQSVTDSGKTSWYSGDTTIFLSSNAARRKNTIAHELAHGVEIEKLGITSSDAEILADADYDGNSSHTMFSAEYQNAANAEGFAHMFAARAWNYSGAGAEAYILTFASGATGHTVYDMEFGTVDYIDNYCDPTPDCDDDGIGTEWDWAHGWWDYLTNDSPGSKPTMPEIFYALQVAWWYAYPWDRDNSHYDDIQTWLGIALGSTHQARFQDMMEYNGAPRGDLIWP